MRVSKDDIPVKIGAPGATARQLSDFGTASGTLGAEYFSLGKGADITPLLEGLEHDLWQSPHWGYVISGAVTVTYRDGTSEQCRGGDVFFWPAWHTVRADDDTEVILFSPQDEHLPVMEHLKAKMGL